MRHYTPENANSEVMSYRKRVKAMRHFSTPANAEQYRPDAPLNAPLDTARASLLRKITDEKFAKQHADLLEKIPDLKALSSEYFQSYFEQLQTREDRAPKVDPLLAECIADLCPGTHAGAHVLHLMQHCAEETLQHPLPAAHASIMALVAEQNFVDAHAELVAQKPELREIAADYFERYFAKLTKKEEGRSEPTLLEEVLEKRMQMLSDGEPHATPVQSLLEHFAEETLLSRIRHGHYQFGTLSGGKAR